MKIVLATPLYPPDIAEPAPYVKELAKRLAPAHQVVVVAYGHLPEKISGVSIVAVSKRRPLPLRLWSYAAALLRAARGADIVYLQNGASVELPLALAGLFFKTPVVVRIGDVTAHERARHSALLRIIESLAFSHAHQTITDELPQKPEVFPFEKPSAAAQTTWEESWDRHINRLNQIFIHATRR